MKKQIYKGRQEDVAAMISDLLGYSGTVARRHILDFIRVQRGVSERTGRSNVFTWRGIGIDVTPRKTACWIEDRRLLNKWRAMCAEDPTR